MYSLNDLQKETFNLGNFAAIKKCISSLDIINDLEKEDHIKENMIGDIPWSLKSILINESRCKEGFFTVLYNKNDKLVAISGCEKTNEVFENSIEIGIRLWINPNYRSLRLPTRVMSDAIKLAKDTKRIAWVSFNEDRKAMLRLIHIRSTDDNSYVADQWIGFKNLPQKVKVFNTMQWIAYKDFRDADLIVTS